MALTGIVVGSVVLLLGGYGGMYHATVKRERIYFISATGCPIPYYATSYPTVPWAEAVFGPIHRLDIRLRPQFWSVQSSSAVSDHAEDEEPEMMDDESPQRVDWLDVGSCIMCLRPSRIEKTGLFVEELNYGRRSA